MTDPMDEAEVRSALQAVLDARTRAADGTPWEDPMLADICSWPFRPEGEQLMVFMHRGDPLPSPRVRVTRHGSYLPKTYHAYRDSLRWKMREMFLSARRDVDEAGRFGVKAVFFRRTQQRTDVDNLLKTLCDAGTGVIWKDDSQIVEQYGRVFLGCDDPRVVVFVYEVDEYPFQRAEREYPCARCGKVITATTRWQRRKFCSKECERPRVETACEECGKPYLTPPSLAEGRHKRKFCGIECAEVAMRKKRKAKLYPGMPRCPDCNEQMSNPKSKKCRACHIKSKAGGKSSLYQWVNPAGGER